MTAIEVGELRVDDARDGGRNGDAFLVDVSAKHRGKSVYGTLRMSSESVDTLKHHEGAKVPSRIVEILAQYELRSGFSFAVQAVANSTELLMLEELRRDVPMPKRL